MSKKKPVVIPFPRQEVPERERKSLWAELTEVELPSALAKEEVRKYIIAAVMVLAIVTLTFTFLSVALLMFLLIPAYMVYSAISIRLDFKDGIIKEMPLICYSVKTLPVRKCTHVSFRTDDEVPSYFAYNIPGKNEVFYGERGFPGS